MAAINSLSIHVNFFSPKNAAHLVQRKVTVEIQSSGRLLMGETTVQEFSVNVPRSM